MNTLPDLLLKWPYAVYALNDILVAMLPTNNA